MKVLVVDCLMESQVQVARVFDALSQSDRDMMDVKINLANERNYLERTLDSDVLIIGPGLAARSSELSHAAKSSNPDIEIILFVSDESYSSHAFREAHSARARKVIPLSAPPLDLLQELVQIHESNRSKGKTRDGRLVVVTQVKGGLGATTLCAALGEAASKAGRKVMLWDLDIESKDLSRALLVHQGYGSVISAWVDGSRSVSRESLCDALVSLEGDASLLPPPDTIPSGMDLLSQLESIDIARNVVDLARVSHDCIIVDTCGRMTPLSGTLLRLAEVVVVLMDDSVLGLSAVPGFMEGLTPYLLSIDRVHFVCAGTKVSAEKLAAKADPERRFPASCWEAPRIPVDPAAGAWPGSRRTLFSTGNKKTQQALRELADKLGILSSVRGEQRRGLSRFRQIFWHRGSFGEDHALVKAVGDRGR